MNIEDTIQLHERLQELIDRKTRLLQDLQVIDKELRTIVPDLLGSATQGVPGQRALPPAGRPAKSGGAPKSRRKKKSTRKSKKVGAGSSQPRRTRKGKGGAPTLQGRAEVVLREFGRTVTLRASMLVEVMDDVEKLAAQNLMVALYKSGVLKRTGRGEYQLK